MCWPFCVNSVLPRSKPCPHDCSYVATKGGGPGCRGTGGERGPWGMCIHMELCSRACHCPSLSSSWCAVVCVLSLHHSPLPKPRHWKYLKEFCGILLQRSELCGLVCVVSCTSPSEWVSACCRNCTISFGLFQALFERHTVRRRGTRVRPLAGCRCMHVHDYVHMCGGRSPLFFT